MVSKLLLQWPNGARPIPFDRVLTVGRSAENDVDIDDPEISRHHATLSATGAGAALICDVGSANGTSVNGIRLQPHIPTRVTPGDNILVGSTLLVIVEKSPSSVPAQNVGAVGTLGVEHHHVDVAGPLPGLRRAPTGRPRRPVAMLVGFTFVLVFMAYISANAVDSKLLLPDYYKGVLEESNAYERAYSEVAPDPALSAEVSDLLGGIDIPLAEIAGAVELVAPPFILQAAVEAAIDRLIEYLKNHRSLDAGIDVTTIIEVTNIGGITDVITDVIGRPTRPAASYEEFLADLETALEKIQDSGSLPDVIPDYDISASNRLEVTDVIARAGGLSRDDPVDAETIRQVEAAISDNDIEAALQKGMKASLLEESSRALIHGKFIQEVEKGGTTRYYLGPPPETTRQLSKVIGIVHMVSWAAGWGRFVAMGLGIVLLAILLALSYPSGRAMFRWAGLALVAGGAFGFFGWWVLRGVAQDRILGATLGEQSTLPASYQLLYKDVLAAAAESLTSTVWAPCFVAMIGGGLLLAVSFAFGRRGPGGSAESAGSS